MTTRRRSQRLGRKRKSYGRKKKSEGADRYGQFDQGKQKTADIIAGHTIWYPRETEES